MVTLKLVYEFLAAICYVRAEDALSVGLTHHGRMFLVPAWVAEKGDDWDATPKCPLLLPYVFLADLIYVIAVYLVPSDVVIVTPIKVLEPIRLPGQP